MTSGTVMGEIGGLADLDLQSIRQRWLDLYECDAPIHMSRKVLIQAIAYRLQEIEFGGLSSSSRARLLGDRAGRRRERPTINRSVKPGTRFVREWQGRTIEVLADGAGRFLYRGRTYRSLSAIARDVTGTRWSGPAFFGLTMAEVKRGG